MPPKFAIIPCTSLPALAKLKRKSDLLCWIAYRAYANSKTGEAYPSAATVADLIGMSRASALRSVRALRAAGLLVGR